MGLVPLPILLLLLFSVLHCPLHSFSLTKATDESLFGHVKEPVPDVNVNVSSSKPFVKVKIDFAISNAAYKNTFSKAMEKAPILKATEDVMVVEAITPEEAKKLMYNNNNELLFSDQNIVIVEGVTLEDEMSKESFKDKDKIIREEQRTSRAHR